MDSSLNSDIKPEPDLEDNPFELSESDDEEELKSESSAVKTEQLTVDEHKKVSTTAKRIK